MADNVNITAGAGTTIATDQCGTDHYQRIKLTDGTADSTTPINVDVGAKENALRVCPANDITDATYIGDIKFGEALPAGTNGIGKLTANSGVDIGDVDITSIVPGVAATNLGKARDVACGANDVGVMALAVRDDALTTLTPVDGDYVPLRVSSTGALHVTGGGGGTEYTEDIATANPIVGTATMMERDDVLGGLTPAEGDWAALRCDANGALWVHDNVVNTLLGTIDSDTNDIKTAVELLDNAVYVDDADWTDNTSSHLLVGGIYQSTPHTVTDGDVSPFQLDVNGKIMVSGMTACNTGAVVLSSGTVTTVSTVTNLSQLGGAAINMGEGTIDTGTQRVTLATDDDGVAHLATIAGDTTSLDGKVTACNTGAVVLSSGTVTTVSTVTNLSQLGGTAISMNEGTLDAGVQRVTLATDDDGVAHLATIAGDTTNIETAVQIIDDWDATQGSAVSSDGPQVMAAYDATKPTAVTDGQSVRVLADSYGRLLPGVEPTRFQAVFDSADATEEGEVVHASAASTVVVIQSYVISSDVEGWIKLQDEDSTALTGKFWLKAGGGVAITLPENAPIVLGTDKDLEVICEAAGNISVSVTGYTVPG